MQHDQHPWVTALFPDRDCAERAFRLVTEHGYEAHEIDVLMSGDTHRVHYGRARDSDERVDAGVTAAAASAAQDGGAAHDPARAVQGAGIGSAVGGAVGLIAAALLAAGASVSLPALGVVIAGPMAALVSGSAAGGLTGGLIGALIGWGVPERHASDMEQALRGGGIVLRLQPHSREEAAAIIEHWQRMQARLLAV